MGIVDELSDEEEVQVKKAKPTKRKQGEGERKPKPKRKLDEGSGDEADADAEPPSDAEPSGAGGEAGGSGSDGDGFAAALNRILKKKVKAGKEPVLAARTKDKQKREEERAEHNLKRDVRKEKKRLLDKDHVVPTNETLDFEKALRRIATRGVVKLFNAVSKQQKTIEEGQSKYSINTKVEKATKQQFLSMLRDDGGAPAKAGGRSISVSAAMPAGTTSWSVVRDEAPGAAPTRMRDFDKESEEESGGESGGASDMDDGSDVDADEGASDDS
eukprot:tig00000711_g3405.t1